MANLPAALAEAIATARLLEQSRLLVDSRGLGKPTTFSNKEEDFATWARKTENYVFGVFKKAHGILAVASEASEAVDFEAAVAKVGDICTRHLCR